MNKIRTVLILIMEFWKCHFGGSLVFLSSRSTMRCHSSMIRPPYNTLSNIQDLKSIPFKIDSFEKNNIISSPSLNYTHLAKTSSHYSTPTLISGSPIRNNNKCGSSNWSAHRPFAKVLWWRRLRFFVYSWAQLYFECCKPNGDTVQLVEILFRGLRIVSSWEIH